MQFPWFLQKIGRCFVDSKRFFLNLQFPREQTIGILMNFNDFHYFDTLLAKRSVSFRDFRVFGGARPCSARPRTRPLQCCLLCVTRILHVLPHGSSFCKPPRPIILIFIYTSHFPSLIPMPGPRNRWFYKRLRWVLRCRLFVVWPCQKPRVSVLRRFCTGTFLVLWFPFVWVMKVLVDIISHVPPHGSSFRTGRREVQLQFNSCSVQSSGNILQLDSLQHIPFLYL